MVDCTGLENRRTERYRGFESLPFRREVFNLVEDFFCFYFLLSRGWGSRLVIFQIFLSPILKYGLNALKSSCLVYALIISSVQSHSTQCTTKVIRLSCVAMMSHNRNKIYPLPTSNPFQIHPLIIVKLEKLVLHMQPPRFSVAVFCPTK